jgi:hypothetical protein
MESNIMMIEDRFFDQVWVQELSNEDFRMLLYLFKYASKCGIIELNMRLLNFAANTGHNYTKEELLNFCELLKPYINKVTLRGID